MQLRYAESSDTARIEALIARSVWGLMGAEYSVQQLAASIGALFGVDGQIIADQTYYVIEQDSNLVAAGGWSYRRTLFGGDAASQRDNTYTDPKHDAARIRAFFVDQAFARSGCGSQLLQHSEEAARSKGFARFELAATLTGKPFYERHAYRAQETMISTLRGGINFPLIRMCKP